jgi:hypothetical protein
MGFQNRLGVGTISLVPDSIPAYVLSWQKHHFVPARFELSRPVVRRSTRLHDDNRFRLPREELEHPRAGQTVMLVHTTRRPGHCHFED